MRCTPLMPFLGETVKSPVSEFTVYCMLNGADTGMGRPFADIDC